MSECRDQCFQIGYHLFSCHKDNFSENNQEYWYPWTDNGFIFDDKGYRTAEACEAAMRKQVKADLKEMLKDLEEEV